MKRNLLTSLLASGAAIAASLVLAAAGQAQDYPNQPIRVIVPFAAGGGTDIATRMWAELVGEKLGQRVLVENMGGAAGTIGTKAGIAAEPDGYTLFAGVASTMSINPYTMADADYDPLTDVQPVTLMTYSPWILISTTHLPLESMDDVRKYAEENPGELTYAGWTGTGEMGRKLLELRSGIELLAVPYAGSVEALTDLVAGRAALAMLDISAAAPFIEAGEVNVVALTSPERSPLLPETPGMEESGVPNFDVLSWTGIFAPVGTPREVIEKINEVSVEVMNTPEMEQRLFELGLEPRQFTIEEFEDFVRAEAEKWQGIIEETGGAS
ncbi:MAG TPA: tripartite tricarboxylate transporter substrate binding protein [Devosiaceae bacterium]|jgi:tripartite-type tricarboxylate transporter receptor subunit TctC|nr:tripartite tricarboxylate transporter substrate binding protein [Devosiaceae bacterium]